MGYLVNIVAAIAIVTAGATAATTVDMRVTLTPPEIPYHRQAVFTITVDAPRDEKVNLPDMTAKFGGADVYGQVERQETPLDDDRVRITATYRLEAVQPGDYIIEPVEVTWGTGGHVTVPSPALRVRELTPEEEALAQQFQPIVEPREVSVGFWRQWTFWLGVVAALAVALALWLAWRRWRMRPVAKPVQVLLPWERALARLDALNEGGEPTTDALGSYYVELTAILREYIEERFQIHAPEQTTPEFLAEAVRTGQFSADHQKLLAGVLRHSDLVKFARHEPTPDEMKQAYSDVRRFVEETIPRPSTSVGEVAA